MQYRIALVCAAIIIISGLLYSWITKRQVESQIRGSLRQLKESGELPPELRDVNIETADIRSFSVKLLANQVAMLSFAQLISNYWFVWIPAIIVLCLGMAALIASFAGKKLKG